MNSSDIQIRNRAHVFSLLLSSGSMTRSQLAGATQLQKGTITNIINEFSEIGIVSSSQNAASARRGEKISLSLEKIYMMAVGITRKDYQIAVFSLDRKVCDHVCHLFSGKESLQQSLDRLKKEGQELLGKYDSRRVLDICLAVPGPYMKFPDGREVFAVSMFPDFNTIGIRKQLEEAFERKITIIHDAKLSAYAEWKASPEVKNDHIESLVCIRSRGYGTGCGTVIDGKIVEGQLGIAGEVGYMGINYNIPAAQGGDFEACAGTDSTVRYAKMRLIEFPDTVLTENSTYYDILDAYKKGDRLARWAIGRMAIMLGYGLANLVYVIDPALFIIGPDYPSDEEFLDNVRKAMGRYLHPLMAENVKIRYSELNEDSFLLGAYYYITEKEADRADFFDKIREIRKLDA